MAWRKEEICTTLTSLLSKNDEFLFTITIEEKCSLCTPCIPPYLVTTANWRCSCKCSVHSCLRWKRKYTQMICDVLPHNQVHSRKTYSSERCAAQGQHGPGPYTPQRKEPSNNEGKTKVPLRMLRMLSLMTAANNFMLKTPLPCGAFQSFPPFRRDIDDDLLARYIT